jgi:hypothetical protein
VIERGIESAAARVKLEERLHCFLGSPGEPPL